MAKGAALLVEIEATPAAPSMPGRKLIPPAAGSTFAIGGHAEVCAESCQWSNRLSFRASLACKICVKADWLP